MARKASDYIKVVRQLEAKIQTLEDQHFEDEQTLTEAKSAVENNLLKSKTANLKLEKFYEENANLLAKLNEVQIKFTNLHGENAILQKAYDKHESVHRKKTLKLQNTIKSLKDQLETSVISNQDLGKNNIVLEKKLAEYEEDIFMFNMKLELLTAQGSQLTKVIKSFHLQQNALQQTCIDKNSEVVKIEQTLANLEHQLKMLESAKSHQTRELENLPLHSTAVEVHRTSAKIRINIMIIRLKNAHEDIYNLQKMSLLRLVQLAKATQNNTILEKQMTGLQGDNMTLIRKINELLEDRRNKADYYNKQTITLKDRIKQMENYTELLQNQLSQDYQKKSLWTFWFGSKPKSAKPQVFTYEELQNMLLEERAQNCKLKAQVRALGGEPIICSNEIELATAAIEQPTVPDNAYAPITLPTCTMTSSSANFLSTVEQVSPPSDQCSAPLQSTSSTTPASGNITEEPAPEELRTPSV